MPRDPWQKAADAALRLSELTHCPHCNQLMDNLLCGPECKPCGYLRAGSRPPFPLDRATYDCPAREY
jgi:hypothetical protein